MPKLWNETIEGHRREVRDAILDAVGSLVRDHGLTSSVTMSGIADTAGIGRATLYKYFADVDAVVVAWHERQASDHLAHLAEVGNDLDDPLDRLRAVLTAYAFMSHQQHEGSELAHLLHRGDRVATAHRDLMEFIRDLLTAAASRGAVRTDIAAGELARYCLHALGAARDLSSKAAVDRLVGVILTGLHATRSGAPER